MAKKARSSHICSECGYTSPKWLGRCPDCGAWGSFQEHQVATSSAAPSVSAKPIGLIPTSPAQSITRIDATRSSTQSTGIGELDRVLGSGIVPGSVVLLAGEPGVGKSTLLLEVASKWAQQKQGSGNRTALYITAEESAEQVRVRAERTGALQDSLIFSGGIQSGHRVWPCRSDQTKPADHRLRSNHAGKWR